MLSCQFAGWTKPGVCLGLWAGLGLCLPRAHCQSSLPNDSAQVPAITATTNLVIVPALVRSASGEMTPALQARDFLLLDNGTAQVVRVEDTEHQPLSVLVLVQTGGAAEEELPLYAKLGTMLSYLTSGVPHRVSLVEFDSAPEYAWEFPSTMDVVDDVLLHTDAGDQGAAILDAVSHGIDVLSKEPAGYRRVILLLSQRHDEGSRARADEVIRRLGENNITIECLSFSPEKNWMRDQFAQPRHENPLYTFAPNVPQLQHTFDLGTPLIMAFKAMEKNTSAEIAALSGGEALPFQTKAELDQQLAALTNHFAATYTLSFTPTSKQPGFHALQLRVVGHPELQVSARTGYWSANGDAKK